MMKFTSVSWFDDREEPRPSRTHEEKDPSDEDIGSENNPDVGTSLPLETNEHGESLKTHKDFSSCKTRIDELLEGLCKKDTDQKNVPAITASPPKIQRENLLTCQEDFSSSRTPITESRCIRPLLQLPRRDNRPHGLDGQLTQLFIEDPKPPIVISKEDWIAMNEDTVVRLSG
jgi:hypothetical protein